jgi:hypothetical protein
VKPHDLKPAKHKATLPNGRSRKAPPKFEEWWAKVYISLVAHPAWKYLSPSAKDVLIVSIAKANNAASKGIKNADGNPRFQFTYAEANKLLRMTSPTFNDAMDKLKQKGFIGVSDPGGILSGKGRPAQYYLSDRWKEWIPPKRDTKNIEKARAARKTRTVTVDLL